MAGLLTCNKYSRAELPFTSRSLLGVLLVVTQLTSAWGLACEESGYCSLGKIKFFTGDISQSNQLWEALNSTSYKQEIIVTTYKGADLWLDQTLQLYHELLGLGFAHVLVISDSAKTCSEIHSFQPELSCVWDSSPMVQHVYGVETYLWHHRWRFMARATRLGFNVMSVDNDVMFFRDPYKHLKSGPLAKVNIMCVFERQSRCECNGGFLYLQNVKPDGASAYMFKQVTDEALRWMDDDFNFTKAARGQKPEEAGALCMNFDQAFLHDGIMSIMTGRELLLSGFLSCHKREWVGPTGVGWEQVEANVLSMTKCNERARFEQVPMPADWEPHYDLPERSKIMTTAPVVVPNLAFGHHWEVGGRMYPEQRGRFSNAFLKQLEGDCPNCPQWPTHRPLPPGAAWNTTVVELDDVPKETFAMVPDWFVSFVRNYHYGLWTPKPGQLPQQVVGHVHRIPWNDPWFPTKTGVRKILGRWDWGLSERVQSTFEGGRSPYAHRFHVKRVLALSPNVDLTRTRSGWEMARILVGLIQVAAWMDRHPVYPDLPCETPWLHAEPSRNGSSCKLPIADMLFWGIPYLVDANGVPVWGAKHGGHPGAKQMGKMARRLREQQQQQQQQQQQDKLQQQGWEWQGPGNHQGDGMGSEAGSGALVGEHERVAARSSRRRRQLQQRRRRAAARRRLGEQQVPTVGPYEATAGLTEPYRMMVALPYMYDEVCLRISMHAAMTMPELRHWLTTNASYGAHVTPGDNNTIRIGDSRIAKVNPPSRPGMSTLEMPRSEIDAPGWSIADTLVELNLPDSGAEFEKFKDEPLLYLDHPIAPRPGTPGSERHRESVTPCRAFQQHPEFDSMTFRKVVDTMGKPGKLVGGKLYLE